jgi:CheY-like chemotaxis protein
MPPDSPITPDDVLATQLNDFDLSFKVFHELMPRKVSEILLVSSPYDAFIMEEEGRLAERIIHEYRGLNLSRPPKLTWVSNTDETFNALAKKKFDLVLTMPRLEGMETYLFCEQLKEQNPDLPIFLLLHTTGRFLLRSRYAGITAVDKTWIWSGNANLLLAIIKSVEDRWNVAHDTDLARVRLIILVEDAPEYYSSLLPLLYKVIVTQTQAIMEDSLNDEHRILKMRARPKILVAESYEEAENLYRQFKPYLLSVLSDVRFPRDGHPDARAGFDLLSMIHAENPDLPLLNLSSEEKNRAMALKIPAVFLNKNNPGLHHDVRSFFITHLGFGDFVFRMPDGKEVGRASNLREMEKRLPAIPIESIDYHARCNHFSTWLMARSEIFLASHLKPVKTSDFANIDQMKLFLVDTIHKRRKGRQKGVVLDFRADRFDPEADFSKFGKGSLGGKARGLAFFTTRLKMAEKLDKMFPDVAIQVPKTLVISTEGFDTFIDQNRIDDLSLAEKKDDDLKAFFLAAKFPDDLRLKIRSFINRSRFPLAVRSSSLLEDAQFQPFAGIYKTYMLPNNDHDPAVRLEQLIAAIKLVYASTFLETPRAYANNTHHRIEEEKMAVIIQRLTGDHYGNYFFPAISGVAQSYNFYPIAHMKPDDGIAHIALGLGRTVVEGGSALRFAPPYPKFLPQFSLVDDILKNAQRYFWVLKTDHFPKNFGFTGTKDDADTLHRLDIDTIEKNPVFKPHRQLFSTYIAQDHRIRDTNQIEGQRILTFANILKYKTIDLAGIISTILEIGQKGLGSPVEIEFALHLPPGKDRKPIFALLQIRPMAVAHETVDVAVTADDRKKAFCYSNLALGHGKFNDLSDIVYVKPETFDPARTIEIADEIGTINKKLDQAGRKYLLVGPGRWGSADRFLGIPVSWQAISQVGAIVEASIDKLRTDPSQGSHFFHNITSLGISYLNVGNDKESFMDWAWLNTQKAANETKFVRHLHLQKAVTIKVDGKTAKAVLLK